MIRTLVTGTAFALLATGVSASTMFDEVFVEFDDIIVESDKFRPGATTDIVDLDVGLIGNNKNVGLAGRIVNSVDDWTFATTASFTLRLDDLMLGDGNKGFDSTTTAFAPTAINGVRDAEFSLVDLSTMTVVDSILLTSSAAPGAFSFSAGPGSYGFLIDGSVDPSGLGSTYDISIATVPVPAALPLLGGALVALGLFRRRAAA